MFFFSETSCFIGSLHPCSSSNLLEVQAMKRYRFSLFSSQFFGSSRIFVSVVDLTFKPQIFSQQQLSNQFNSIRNFVKGVFASVLFHLRVERDQRSKRIPVDCFFPAEQVRKWFELFLKSLIARYYEVCSCAVALLQIIDHIACFPAADSKFMEIF